MTVVDLGDAVVLLPPGGRQRLLAEALTAEDHWQLVESLDDADLATRACGYSASAPHSPTRGFQQALGAGGTPPRGAQHSFRAQVVALPPDIAVLSMRDLAWPMAQLQARHRADGRSLSAAMVEALAAAHDLDGPLAVSRHDVGPNLKAAAESDGIPFHIL